MRLIFPLTISLSSDYFFDLSMASLQHSNSYIFLTGCANEI